MHLKINGTSIPTHGKLEVDIYLDEVGEQFPEGAVVRIHDGPLKLHGRPEGPGLSIVCDQPIELEYQHVNPGILIVHYNKDINPIKIRPIVSRDTTLIDALSTTVVSGDAKKEGIALTHNGGHGIAVRSNKP